MRTFIQCRTANDPSAKMAFTFFLSFFLLSQAFAGIIVIPASCRVEISADKAANANSPEFTPLADIILKEVKRGDFVETKGKARTLILTAPYGWTFNPASGSISYKNARDLEAVSLKVSSTTITINFTVTGTSKLDEMSIYGVEVQAGDGAAINCPVKIYRSSNNPGTAIVHGISATCIMDGSCGTGFAELSQKSGMADRLVFASNTRQVIAGTIMEQQPVIITQDQFGNPTVNGLEPTQLVKIKLSAGTGSLAGTVLLNIGTSGGNGMLTFDNLQINTPGIKKMIATSGSLTFAVTNEFFVSDDETSTSIPDENPDWICFL